VPVRRRRPEGARLRLRPGKPTQTIMQTVSAATRHHLCLRSVVRPKISVGLWDRRGVMASQRVAGLSVIARQRVPVRRVIPFRS